MVILARRYRVMVVLGAVALGIAWALMGSPPTTSSPSRIPPAVDEFSALSGMGGKADAAVNELVQAFPGSDGPDLARARSLLTGLGRFDSRVAVLPSKDGATICYGLFGARPSDPAGSYCYQPNHPSLPSPIAGEHFSAMALYSALPDGPRVQLFGIAFDDVVALRVEVSGEWVAVPVRGNAFYLDVPDASTESVGVLEATLADGSVQLHDMRTGG